MLKFCVHCELQLTLRMENVWLLRHVVCGGIILLGLVAGFVVLVIASVERWISPYVWLYIFAGFASLCIISCMALAVHNVLQRNKWRYSKVTPEDLEENSENRNED